MRKRLFILLSVLGLLCVTALALFLSKGGGGDRAEIYCIRNDGGVLSPTSEKRAIYEDDSESYLPRLLIEALAASPGRDKLLPAIPPGTKIISVYSAAYFAQHNCITVNLSGEYLRRESREIAVSDYCILKTLTGVEDIFYIRLLIEGRPHPLHEGGYIYAGAFLTDYSALELEEQTYKLYLPEKDTFRFKEVSVTAFFNKNLRPEERVLGLLLRGPEGYEEYALSPGGNGFHDVFLNGGVITVNLHGKILKEVEEVTDLLRFISIVQSLTEIYPGHSVRFLFDGEGGKKALIFDFSEEFVRSDVLDMTAGAEAGD